MNNFVEILGNVSVVASSNSDSMALLIPLIAPFVVFFAVYMGIYKYYRNTDKRFKFENETFVEVWNMKEYDNKIDRITGTSRSKINGDNSSKHLQRVNWKDVILEL